MGKGILFSAASRGWIAAALLAAGFARGTDVWPGSEWISGDIAVPTADADFYRDAPMPVLRRAFTVGRPVRSAVLRVAGLGYRDVSLNGRRLTSTAFPLWTPFARRVLFDSFNVKDALAPGANELRIELGNGWYAPLPLRMWGGLNLRKSLACGVPCARVVLTLEYADGTAERIVSDTSWQAAPGPVVRNNIYLGETFDARRETSGWTAAKPVQGPAGRLDPAEAPAVAVRERWTAKCVRALKPGICVADFGVNFGGMAAFRLRGTARGGCVRFRYGELLNPDGTVNTLTAVCGQIKGPGVGGPGAPALAEACDVYFCRGEAEEWFEPRFSFHSFRYVQIEGAAVQPRPEDCEALACASAVEDAADFECSNERLNELHRVCRRTFLSNLMGVQSDCPGREKFGYGGDIAATAETFCQNFDMAAFYRKTVRDFLDEAAGDGWFTETAPYVGIADGSTGGRSGPVGWTVCVPVLLDYLYRYYGDTRTMAEAYPACVRYLGLLEAKFPAHIIPVGIGDHEAVEKAPVDLTATAHFHQWAALTARFARLLGKDAEAVRFEALAGQIRAAFQARYVRGGKVGPGFQDCQAFGLYHDLVPAEHHSEALDLLRRDVAAKGNALTTGLFATPYLLEILSTEGSADLAGEIVTHRGFPGWMAMLDAGATTVWEHWAGSDNTFSQNHPMFGSVDGWLLRHVLGIAVARDACGCDKVIIRPQPVAGVTWAKGSYRTPRGVIRVSWKLADGRVVVEKQVPAGVSVKE